jgi:hypothetical protein
MRCYTPLLALSINGHSGQDQSLPIWTRFTLQQRRYAPIGLDTWSIFITVSWAILRRRCGLAERNPGAAVLAFVAGSRMLIP